jgi:hypothetical protein
MPHRADELNALSNNDQVLKGGQFRCNKEKAR